MALKANIYYAAIWKDPVDGGVTGTKMVELLGFAKSNSEHWPYSVANEYIANRIGMMLGLPVPPGAVIQDEKQEERAWVSLTFTPKGEVLPPVDPEVVVAAVPELSAQVCIFDLLIANNDRHCGNLAFMEKDHQQRLEVFDHGHALLGTHKGEVRESLSKILDSPVIDGASVRGGNRHCLLDWLSYPGHIFGALDRLDKLISNAVIEQICEDAFDLSLGVSSEETESLTSFLKIRRDRLREIVKANQEMFPLIKDWGLGV